MRHSECCRWIHMTAVLAACNPGEGALPGAEVAVRDSAGVEIVDNEAAPPSLGIVVEVSRRQVLSPGRNLDRIRGIRIQGDGTIVMANAGMQDLIFIKPTTGEVSVSGRGGQGPGEFETITGLGLCRGDSVVVLEETRGLMHLFDRHGTYVTRAYAMLKGGRPWGIPGVGGDCRSLAVLEQDRSADREGPIHALPLTVSWYDVQAEDQDDVATLPGLESFLLPELGGYVKMPFGNMPSFAVADDRMYVGAGTVASVESYDRQGRLVRSLRWQAEREPLSEGDRARYHSTRDMLIERYGPNYRRGFRRMEEYPVRLKPLYARMMVDGDDRLWVQQYPGNWAEWVGLSPGREAEAWWIFAPSGQLLGVGTTPPGLVVHDVRNGMLVGVARDADDVEEVHLYPLTKEFMARAGASR